MANVLVTGAAGFIGSHVAERLLDRGDAVIGLDDLNDYYPVPYKRENLAELDRHRAFCFYEGDICDRDLVSKVLARHGVDHIAHLAARAGVRPSIEVPALYVRANVDGTLSLLQCAAQYEIKNFVLTSSSSVYGSSRDIPFREDDSSTERPVSPYAATKKAAELLGYTFHHLYGLNVNVVRPFTVYGPRGRPDMAPWLFIQAATTGGPVRKFGDGTSQRDYTFIDDFTTGFLAALDRPFGYEIFNLGRGETVTLNELIETVSHIAGRPLNVVEAAEQPGDVPRTFADVTKARGKLAYAPHISLADGMQRFYDWYQQHRA